MLLNLVLTAPIECSFSHGAHLLDYVSANQPSNSMVVSSIQMLQSQCSAAKVLSNLAKNVVYGCILRIFCTLLAGYSVVMHADPSEASWHLTLCDKSLICVGNLSLTKCDKGDKAKSALLLCRQLCYQR